MLAAVCWPAAAADASWIQRYAEESPLARRDCEAKQFDACRERLKSLLGLLDGRVDIVYRLAKVEASAGDPAAALRWLGTFSRMGLPLVDPAADPDFAALRDHPQFAEVLARLRAAREPVSHSRPFLTLPASDLVAEDIAYDPVGDRFYISSVRHREIVSLTRAGAAADFLREGTAGVWAMLALGIDAKRRILWATTAAMPEALGYRAEDRGRSALLKYDLRSGALVKRYDAPRDGEHVLGDLTVAPNGDVFVSDGHGPVYWVDHRGDRLEELIPAGVFRSPQTPALTPDRRRLLVPDFTRGISVVDLKTRQTWLMSHPSDLSLGGIDGMYLAGRSLVAIQNGTSPARVIRMRLNSSLEAIESWETLEANWDGLDPTHGALATGKLYFIANSGWDRLADDGSPKPGAVFTAPTIRELADFR